MGKSYVGDIGTRIRITLDSDDDLTNATEVLMLIRRPDETELSYTATVEDVGPPGIAYYDVIDGDFNQAGKYYAQLKVTFSDGDVLKSETKGFTVYEAYE